MFNLSDPEQTHWRNISFVWNISILFITVHYGRNTLNILYINFTKYISPQHIAIEKWKVQVAYNLLNHSLHKCTEADGVVFSFVPEIFDKLRDDFSVGVRFKLVAVRLLEHIGYKHSQYIQWRSWGGKKGNLPTGAQHRGTRFA